MNFFFNLADMAKQNLCLLTDFWHMEQWKKKFTSVRYGKEFTYISMKFFYGLGFDEN